MRTLEAPSPAKAERFRKISGIQGLGTSAIIGAKMVRPRQKKLQMPYDEITKFDGKRSMWIA